MMISKGAIISIDDIYRYSLWRIWNPNKPLVNFIGLNPSTADGQLDDPTIRRCIGYATDWDYGGLYMTNLFAFRATDPKNMKRAVKPVGIENNAYLTNISLFTCQLTVLAWGNEGKFLNRDKEVIEMLTKPVSKTNISLYCLDQSKNGNPKHPLYLKKTLTPKLFI